MSDILKELLKDLKADKYLFPDGFPYDPDISYTDRIYKTYYGSACKYKNYIKINSAMREYPKKDHRNVVRYLIYHEMLHFVYDGNHDNHFKEMEKKYPDFVRIESALQEIPLAYLKHKEEVAILFPERERKKQTGNKIEEKQIQIREYGTFVKILLWILYFIIVMGGGTITYLLLTDKL